MTLKMFWKEKFDILEAIRLIQKAWSEVTQRQLNSAWRKLCPSCVQGDGDDVPEIMDETVTTARGLELEVNEDDIEELIMEHEDDLTAEELQELLNEEHQETQRDVSPEKEEDEKGPMPTSAIKDLLKKWGDVRATVLEWHPNHVEVNRVGDLYNDNAINHFRKILKKRERQSTLDRFFNAPQTKKPRTD
jgi:hypothetical protein